MHKLISTIYKLWTKLFRRHLNKRIPIDLDGSYSIAYVMNEKDANDILSYLGYTSETDLKDIHEKLVDRIAQGLSQGAGYNRIIEPWFRAVGTMTRLSAIVPQPDGTCEFQFKALSEMTQFPVLPSPIMDIMTETPEAFIINGLSLGMPHKQKAAENKDSL